MNVEMLIWLEWVNLNQMQPIERKHCSHSRRKNKIENKTKKLATMRRKCVKSTDKAICNISAEHIN